MYFSVIIISVDNKLCPTVKVFGIPLDNRDSCKMKWLIRLKDALWNFVQAPSSFLPAHCWCFESHLWTLSISFKVNVAYVVGRIVFETERRAAPFNTSQGVASYSRNLFPGFISTSCRAQFLNPFLFLFQVFSSVRDFFFPIRLVDCCWLSLSLSLRHLVAEAQLFCLSLSQRHRDTAGLIGNNPSAVITVVQHSFFLWNSKEYLLAICYCVWWCWNLLVFRITGKLYVCSTSARLKWYFFLPAQL